MTPLRLTREATVRAYQLLVKEGTATPAEREHFIQVFNALIVARWSMAGLRWIKDQAWRRA
mgnify:FL=1